MTIGFISIEKKLKSKSIFIIFLSVDSIRKRMLYVLSFSKTRQATTNSIFRYVECWLTIYKKNLGHYYLHNCWWIFSRYSRVGQRANGGYDRGYTLLQATWSYLYDRVCFALICFFFNLDFWFWTMFVITAYHHISLQKQMYIVVSPNLAKTILNFK